jgi:hypothetical protein|tara:strand:+ start:849 stop:1154 length:306 start_codon:yes stop_codon:yes gene_type:complete
MIKLNNNYSIVVDGTHGFQLNYESDPFEKNINTKKGPEVKQVTSKDTWYYPRLSGALKRFISENLSSENIEELILKVENIESAIEKFNKTFANQGNTFSLK